MNANRTFLLIFFLASVFAGLDISVAASVVNRGARIVIMPGTSMHLEASSSGGNFLNLSDGSGVHGHIVLQGTMSVPGNWTNGPVTGEVFGSGSTGTVRLTGSGQIIAGKTSFPNLIKVTVGPDTLYFGSGAEGRTTVTGTLVLQGTSDHLLLLRSSSPGVQWELDSVGERDLVHLDVEDSNNISAAYIDVSGAGCVDSGNNTRWIFPILVVFSAGANGSLFGNTLQYVVNGGSTDPVAAIPDPGYFFSGWSGGYTGNMNPLIISNVTSSIAVTAIFSSTVSSHTVSFLSGKNGRLIGEALQEIEDGHSSIPVSAIPDDGYYFSGWTGDWTGTMNPLTIEAVVSDMAVTANFAPLPYSHIVVNFIAESNGALGGNVSQIVVVGGRCRPVFAVPNANWHFAFWSGDVPPGKELDNPLILENISSSMTVAANFAPNEFGKVTVSFIPGRNGTVQGDPSQTVDTGSDCSPVLAVPEEGYSFLGWTSDSASLVSSKDNPIVITATENMLVAASFGTEPDQLAFGKIYTARPSDIEGFSGDSFISKPSLVGIFQNPLNGKIGQKANMKVLNRISKGDPQPLAECELSRMIRLFNPRQFSPEQTCLENLLRLFPPDGRIPALALDPVLATARDDVGRLFSKVAIGSATLHPPVINSVLDSYGAEISGAAPGDVITIQGIFFGRPAMVNGVFVGNTLPHVYLEYPKKDRIARLRLKPVKPYNYANFNGVEGMSCMDIRTGASSISVRIPEKWPAVWSNNDQHNIVIDNRTGVATVPFRTSE